MDQFPKFFHHMIRKNIPYVHITKISTTCNMLLHYLVKVENPKMLPNFYVERDS